MPTIFSRSMRSLERDGFRITLGALLLVSLLLALWGAWFFGATVSLYAVTDWAWVEVDGEPNVGIVAELDEREARRVRPGQRAWFRLEGQGTIEATVTGVASEIQGGKIRVELSVDEAHRSRLPEGSGFHGRVEIEVERVSPAALVLRSVGRN